MNHSTSSGERVYRVAPLALPDPIYHYGNAPALGDLPSAGITANDVVGIAPTTPPLPIDFFLATDAPRLHAASRVQAILGSVGTRPS